MKLADHGSGEPGFSGLKLADHGFGEPRFDELRLADRGFGEPGFSKLKLADCGFGEPGFSELRFADRGFRRINVLRIEVCGSGFGKAPCFRGLPFSARILPHHIYPQAKNTSISLHGFDEPRFCRLKFADHDLLNQGLANWGFAQPNRPR